MGMLTDLESEFKGASAPSSGGLLASLEKEVMAPVQAAPAPVKEESYTTIPPEVARQMMPETVQAEPAQAAPVDPATPYKDAFKTAVPAEEASILNTLGRAVLQPASMLASAVGATETGIDIANYSAEHFPAKTQNVEDLSAGDIPTYLAERFGENLGNMAVTLGAGAVGGAAAGSVVPGPGTVIGAAAGAGLAAFGLAFGEVRQNIQQATGKDDPVAAIPAATANAALELLPVGRIAKNLGIGPAVLKAVDKTVVDNPVLMERLKRTASKAGKEFLIVGGLESGTELIQDFNSMVTEKVLQDKDVLALSDIDKSRLLNSLAGGFAGGSMSGGVSVVGKQVVDELSAKAVGMRADPIEEMKAVLTALKVEAEEKTAVLEQEAAAFEKQLAGNQDPEAVLEKMHPSLRPQNINPFNPMFEPEMDEHKYSTWTVEQTTEDGNVVPGKFDPDNIEPGQVVATRSKTATDAEFAWRKQAAEHVQKLVSQLNIPGLRVALVDSSQMTDLVGGNNSGSLGNMTAANGLLYLNVNTKQTANQTKSANATIKEGQDTLVELRNLDTLHHELGHGVYGYIMAQANPRERLALMKSYKDAIEEQLKSSVSGARNMRYGPAANFVLHKQGVMLSPVVPYSVEIKNMGTSQRRYALNADEYGANMFARWAANRIVGKKLHVDRGLTSIFTKAFSALQRLHRLVSKYTKTPESFSSYLDRLLINEKARKLEEAIAAAESMNADNLTAEEKSLKAEIVAEGLITAQAEIGNTTTSSILRSGTLTESETPPSLLEKMGFLREDADIRKHSGLHLGFARIAALLTPIQLAELSVKSGFKMPDEYMRVVRAFADTKTKLVESVNATVTEWKNLGQAESEKLSRVLYAVSEMSDELKRPLSKEELNKIFDDYRLGAEARTAWADINESFRNVLTRVEAGLIYDAIRVYIEDTNQAKAFRDAWLAAPDLKTRMDLIQQITGEEVGASLIDDLLAAATTGQTQKTSNALYDQLLKIEKSINQLRNRNYFPRTRLGRYLIRVTSTEKGQIWENAEATRAGETLGFYGFDTKADRDAALKDFVKWGKDSGVAIVGEIAETELFALSAMPQVLIDKIADEMEMTAQQRQTLNTLSLNMSPGKAFLKHLQRRKGIDGFSMDAMRVYANYMTHAGNHIARVEHGRDLTNSLKRIDDYLKEQRQTGFGLELDNLVRIRDYFWKHFDYLMKPDNELASLRAMAFVLYLGFNVKSAVVNLTQLPLVTLPVLTGRYGDIKSAKALANALKDISSMHFKSNVLSVAEQEFIQKLREQGVIDESMVSELAGLGEANVLQRTIPFFSHAKNGRAISDIVNKTAYYSGSLFRCFEKYNRLVTALAAYRLEMARSNDGNAAHESARWAVESSQFEYSRWNRPTFMRGKRSIFFVFQAYLQHAMYLFSGGQGGKTAGRMWLMCLLASGLQGLPGSEIIYDLIDGIGTTIKELFGDEDPRVATRDWMREMLMNVTDRPDMFMHGLGRYYGLGPLHIASLFGAPIPNVDISGSMSYGYMIPGLKPLLNEAQNPMETTGRVASEIVGPVLGYPLAIYQAMNSQDSDSWKAAEKTLPTFMKNISAGTRLMTRGRETFKGDGTLVDFTDIEGRISASLKMLGFQPTEMSQAYEKIHAKNEAKTYYNLRRNGLLQDYYLAKREGPEAVADMNKEIAKYNAMVGMSPELRPLKISPRDKNMSYRARLRAMKMAERGLSTEKRTQRVEKEIDKLY